MPEQDGWRAVLLPHAAPDAAAAEQALRLVHQVDALPLPAPRLPGWESLAADGYAEAVGALQRTIGLVRASLSIAADVR